MKAGVEREVDGVAERGVLVGGVVVTSEQHAQAIGLEAVAALGAGVGAGGRARKRENDGYAQQPLERGSTPGHLALTYVRADWFVRVRQGRLGRGVLRVFAASARVFGRAFAK